MYLKRLKLINFKNYTDKEFEFVSKINLIVGPNGIGKTNLIDSIYYLSFCKSYFNSVDSQNISHDKDYFFISGEFVFDETTEIIQCSVKKNTKKIFKRNDKEYPTLSEHIGLIPAVMIAPTDNQLITGGSEERRRFIDSTISQFNKNYLKNLIKYNKALMQRNKILKDFKQKNQIDNDLLDIIDHQLIIPGNEIFTQRQDFTSNFMPVFTEIYPKISGNTENVGIEYESDLKNNDFKKLLIDSKEKDLILEYTNKGIHKDDLIFKLNNYLIRRIGSQGQQKSLLIALKFAQYNYLVNLSQVKPILLLDDIFDKLDEKRVTNIINFIVADNFGQIFITDTNKKRLEEIIKKIQNVEYKFFEL
jgi:DNA replication and repair protein RecF